MSNESSHNEGRQVNRSDLQGVRVLVTGASGFLGRHLCQHLSGRGALVHGAARRSSGDGIATSIWHTGDLAAPGVAAKTVEKSRPDFVFHLAGLVRGARELDGVLPMLEANLVATVRLLEAVSRIGEGRVVVAGSLEEPESPAAAPASPYAASKGAATLYQRLFAELYLLPVVRARIFMVYGPGAQDENKLVPYVIRELLAGRSPRLSAGRRPVDWIHVRDVVEGLAAIATSTEALAWSTSSTASFDLGSGELVEVRRVVERLCALVGSTKPPALGALEDRANEVVEKADVDATQRAIGWRPAIDLEQGLRDTVDWFRRHPTR